MNQNSQAEDANRAGVAGSMSSIVAEMNEDEEKEKATRHNSGKPKVSLVLEAREAIEGIAKVMEHGAKNHGRKNWRAGDGLPMTEVLDSLTRHTLAVLSGEDIDEESGLPHVDLIATNGLMLSQLAKTNPNSDDRV